LSVRRPSSTEPSDIVEVVSGTRLGECSGMPPEELRVPPALKVLARDLRDRGVGVPSIQRLVSQEAVVVFKMSPAVPVRHPGRLDLDLLNRDSASVVIFNNLEQPALPFVIRVCAVEIDARSI
jgi:hypothetical protein